MSQKSDDVQILVRCSSDVRNKVLEVAERKGQSVTEWVRRAILHELEREKTITFLDSNNQPISMANEDEIAEIIKKVIQSMKKEGTI